MAPLVAVEMKPEIAYYVGKHSRPLSDYPLWARWFIRAVYFWTGYQVTAEAVGIASSRETADKMCLDPSYFYKPLYVNQALPPEPSAFAATVWPRSEASELYEKHSPDMVAVPRNEWNQLQSKITEVCKAAHKA